MLTLALQKIEIMFGDGIQNFIEKKLALKIKSFRFWLRKYFNFINSKIFRDENGNLKGLYGYETDFKSKKILIDNKLYFNFYSKKQKMFDIIVANQVYEHLDSLERIKFIKQSKKLLKEWLTCCGFPICSFKYEF